MTTFQILITGFVFAFLTCAGVRIESLLITVKCKLSCSTITKTSLQNHNTLPATTFKENNILEDYGHIQCGFELDSVSCFHIFCFCYLFPVLCHTTQLLVMHHVCIEIFVLKYRNKKCCGAMAYS